MHLNGKNVFLFSKNKYQFERSGTQNLLTHIDFVRRFLKRRNILVHLLTKKKKIILKGNQKNYISFG